MEWHTSSNGINFAVENGRSIDRVIFDRWNDAAGVTEKVSIHWTEVFKWAAADKCGGMGLSGVEWSDGLKSFASGRYSNGLMAIHVGAYGPCYMIRPAMQTA